MFQLARGACVHVLCGVCVVGPLGWRWQSGNFFRRPPTPTPPTPPTLVRRCVSFLVEQALVPEDDCIIPPPDIRVIADKTADFVARNGPDFEARIMATNQGNAKFRFLSSNDPFRAYYDKRVREVRASVAEEKAGGGAAAVAAAAAAAAAAATPAPAPEPSPSPEETAAAEVCTRGASAG